MQFLASLEWIYEGLDGSLLPMVGRLERSLNAYRLWFGVGYGVVSDCQDKRKLAMVSMCDMDLLPSLNANRILMRIGLHMNWNFLDLACANRLKSPYIIK